MKTVKRVKSIRKIGRRVKTIPRVGQRQKGRGR